MPKEKPHEQVRPQITSSIVRDVVAQSGDFGHELRVKAIVEKFKPQWTVHGGTYTDPVEKVPRQFDLRMQLRSTDSQRWIELAIECKNLSVQDPVVICGQMRARSESTHNLVVSEVYGSPQVGQRMTWRSLTVDPSGFYPPEKFVGKSAGRVTWKNSGSRSPGLFVFSNDDDIYDRWSQAVSSCNDLVMQATMRSDRAPVTFVAVVPILVMPDGALWNARYDERGEFESVEQIDSCELFIQREIELARNREGAGWTHRISHIHLLTLRGFEQLLSAMTPDSAAWKALFPVRP